MKRKLSLFLRMLLTVVLLGTLAPLTFAAGQPIKLKLAAYHADGTYEAKVLKAFIDEVQAKTHGAVQIQFFPGGSLIGPKEMYDGVSSGIADIGAGDLGYTPGKFPETELALAPLGITSPYSFTHALNDFYTKKHPKEFNGTHVLFLWGNGPAVLMTTKPVVNLESIKGLRIRAHGANGTVAKALGASPQHLPMPDVFDGLSKGVMAGVLVDPSVLVSFRLGDVVKEITDLSKAVGNGFVFYVTMNKNAWNKLPPDVQAVFNQVAAAWVEKTALAINQEDIDGIQYARKAGVKIDKLTADETVKWHALTQSIATDYAKSLVKRGFSINEQNENLKYLQERLSYWTGQQVKLKIPFPL